MKYMTEEKEKTFNYRRITMKISIKRLFVLLAIVMSLVVVQSGWSQETYTVAGTVYSISTYDSVIQVDEGDGIITTVYCIPFTHLAKKHHIVLDVGDAVRIEVYDRNFSNKTTKFIAISLSAYNQYGQWVTVQLR
jgi:hypothetical protein